MKIIGIIPARYDSTRLPGKPLLDIGGMTMIERTYRQAAQALPDIVVATDDQRIINAVREFGGNAVLTSPTHRSGTDRCREALDLYAPDADAVVNIQGDEPFIDPRQIELVTQVLTQRDTAIATLARQFDSSLGYEALADPNLVKLTIDLDGYALAFSRSVIPYVKGVDPREWPYTTNYLTHIGLYGYRADTLRLISHLRPTPLEIAESLEQLRWLQNGLRIKVSITDLPTIGIDTQADLEAARQLCESKK